MPANSDDKFQRLINSLKRSLKFYIGDIKTDPVEGWEMNRASEDDGHAERVKIWETIHEYKEEVFPLSLPWYGETTIEFPHMNESARQIFINRSFDPNEFHILSEFLAEGMTFLDIGANSGLYSVFASKMVGATGRVIAFEPSRREAMTVNRNADLNHCINLKCFQFAVGAEDGDAILSVADSEFDGHNSLAGLSIFRTYPNIRYTIDGEEYFWTSFAGQHTEIAIGKAQQVEVMIYSDGEFDFELRSMRVGPEGIETGPWNRDIGNELIPTLPNGLFCDYSQSLVSTHGEIKLEESGDALRIMASENGGGIAFRWSLDPEQEALVSIEGLPRSEAAREQYAVNVVSLDSFFQRWGNPAIDVIKIDVEGSEPAVLEGAKSLISEHQPLILIEVANELLESKSVSAASLVDFFSSNNYILFDAKLGKPRLVDLLGEHSSNVFAVPERFLDQMLKLGGLKREDLTAGLSKPKKKPAKRAKKKAPATAANANERESDPSIVVEAQGIADEPAVS